MRVGTAVLILVVALVVAGLPGLTGVAPRIEDTPWGVTTYEFAYSVDVANYGTVSARNMTIRVALLRDFAPFQAVDNMAVVAPGYVVAEDELGNRFALYSLPELAPGASFVANFTARVSVYGIDFSGGDAGFVYETPPAATYTSPEPFLESSDPRILNVSRMIRANATGPADYVYRSYVWTTQHLTYEIQPQERGALWALKTTRGMCYEYSNLYAALLRAEGYAARRVNGWGDQFQAGEVHRAEAIAHAWLLVYNDEQGWLPADPTFGDVHLYENFLKVNDMHVILTEGIDRHFYRVAYERALGTNVQVDYTVQVLSRSEQNLSPARTVVLVGLVSVPLFLAVVVTAEVVGERRRRIFLDDGPGPAAGPQIPRGPPPPPPPS